MAFAGVATAIGVTVPVAAGALGLAQTGPTTGRQAPTAPTATRHTARDDRMPNVIGMHLTGAEARIRLEVTSPQFTIRHTRTRSVPPGTVVAQSPAAGSPLRPQNQILLTVADG
jgi:hypothetical protein